MAKRTLFRFSTISVTSSMTPGMVVNSCCTPSMVARTTAAPWSDERSSRRRELPMVVPNPRSSGSHVNFPYMSLERASRTSCSGRTSSVQLRVLISFSPFCIGLPYTLLI